MALDVDVSGNTLTVREETIPNVPPPPPRSAQKRSSLEVAVAVIISPAPVTTSHSSTWSALRPYLDARGPCPPPLLYH